MRRQTLVICQHTKSPIFTLEIEISLIHMFIHAVSHEQKWLFRMNIYESKDVSGGGHIIFIFLCFFFAAHHAICRLMDCSQIAVNSLFPLQPPPFSHRRLCFNPRNMLSFIRRASECLWDLTRDKSASLLLFCHQNPCLVPTDINQYYGWVFMNVN